MLTDVECQWVENTKCYVVMATLDDCVGVYTCIRSHTVTTT